MTTHSIQPAGQQTLAAQQALDAAIDTFLAGKAENTQAAYSDRLRRFLDWKAKQPPASFLADLNRYIAHLKAEGLSPRSVQAHVNTVKGLLKTAAALDTSGTMGAQLPQLDLAKPPAVRGELQGDRLTSPQRQTLVELPGVDTHKGRRDTAILGLMVDCGLRRSEVSRLDWRHIGEVDGYKTIKNLRSKHGRVRTVKLPVPLWRLLHQWADAAGLDTSPDAPVFVTIHRGDHVQHGDRLMPSSVSWLVKHYAEQMGHDEISAHDLRRTAAKLARKRGASIEQVQVMLGHESPITTSAYIGETLDLDDHAVDYSDVRYPGAS